MSSLKSLSVLAAVAAALCATAPARASVVVDQIAPVNYTFMGVVDRSYAEFHPTADNIAGAGIHIDSVSDPSDTLVFSIYNGSDVSPVTHVATGPAIVTATVPIALGWVEAFWSPVALTPGASYFLGVASTTPGSFEVYSGSYAALGAFYQYAFDYGALGYHVAFEEFADTAFSAAPEPASLAFIGMGLLGLAAARRRARTA